MNVQRFEQEILKLAFETNARLTPASVAYYLGVPSREANQLLNTLLEEGVLELDSDSDGNLFYRVPHQDIIAHELQAFDDLHAEEEEEALEREEADEEAASLSAPPTFHGVSFVSLDDDAEEAGVQAEALSPSRHRPPEQSALRATDGGAIAPATPPPTPRAVPSTPASPVAYPTRAVAEAPDAPAPSVYSGLEGVVRRREEQPTSPSSRGRNVLVGVARSMEPDAWVGQCGASSVVVTTEARCEPKPLSESRPILTSCEPDAPASAKSSTAIARSATSSSSSSSHGEWWDRPSPEQHHGGAMVLATDAGNMPMRMEDIEQPEHQPGIALLLSLILCGTGQIYNGEVSKGIMMMVMCFLLWFVLLGWVVHIWSIVDAVVVAERINRRKLAEVF